MVTYINLEDTILKKPLIYLASPYTHKSVNKMKTRFVQICKVSGKLIKEGHHILCPIASSHPIAKYGHIDDTGWSYWKELDLHYIDACDEVWLTFLDNEWRTSIGMKAEFEYALAHNKPVRAVSKDGKLLYHSKRQIAEFYNLEDLIHAK